MFEPPVSSADGLAVPQGAARLDPAALKRLSELDPGGQGALVSRVLKAYIGSLASLRDELRQARESGASDVMRRVAHTLKSSSASIGAADFVALCARVEAAVRAGDSVELPRLLDELELEAHRVEHAVQTLLSS